MVSQVEFCKQCFLSGGSQVAGREGDSSSLNTMKIGKLLEANGIYFFQFEGLFANDFVTEATVSGSGLQGNQAT